MPDQQLTDEEILALLDEEGDEELLAKLAANPNLQAQFNTAKTFETKLTQQLQETKVIDQEVLADYLVGILNDTMKERVEAELKRSPTLQYQLERLEQVMQSAPLAKTHQSAPPSNIIYFPDMNHLPLAKVRGEHRVLLSPDSKPIPLPLDESGENVLFLAVDRADASDLILVGQLVITQHSDQWEQVAVFLYKNTKLQTTFWVDDTHKFQHKLNHSDPLTIHLVPSVGKIVVIEDIEIQP